ncbi:hypothetical protein ACNO7L_08365 [Bisgaard Taxon 45]
MKKLCVMLLIFCFCITGCSNHQSPIQGTITHAKFFDNYVAIQINEKSYFLSNADSKTIQKFKNFYRDYYKKVTKQALTLNELETKRKSDFTYSFFIENTQLNQNTKFELKKLYGAEPYNSQYMIISFSAEAQPYYKKDVLDEKYRLEHSIPILITKTDALTNGEKALLMLTSPAWVPFMLLFGLKV